MEERKFIQKVVRERILAEKRKHKNIEWVKLASIKITNEILNWKKVIVLQTKEKIFDDIEKEGVLFGGVDVRTENYNKLKKRHLSTSKKEGTELTLNIQFN